MAGGLFRIVTTAICIALAWTAAARAGDLGGLDGAPVDVSGGDMKFVKEKQALVLRAYAALSRGGVNIKARNLVYFRETKEVYAEGDVTMQQGPSLFRCDRLYYNLETHQGEAVNVRVIGENPLATDVPQPTDVDSPLLGPGSKGNQWEDRGVPINRGFVEARKVRSIGRDHQELHGVSFTNDNSASPVARITSGSAQFRRGEKIETWNNVLWIGKLPVFYFPYIIKDLRYDWPWMRISGGSNDRWGSYVLTTWGMDMDPDAEDIFRLEKIFVDVDWRQDRGWAVGPAFKYELGHTGRSIGHLETYYTKETAISRGDDAERAEDDTEYGDLYRDDERWKVRWDHFQDLPRGWDLRAEVEAYSDRDFQKEYFRNSYYNDKEPEAALSLRRRHDDFVFEVVAKKRVNDYQTQEEYLPEARFTLPGYQVGATEWYVKSDTVFGVINRKFDEKLDQETVWSRYKVLDDDEYDPFFRAHNDTRLYRPIPLGKALTLTPYVGGNVTYYSDLYDDDEGHTRGAALYGADLAGRFYGVFRDGGLRHIIEPTISFVANADPNIDPDDIWEVDAIDLYHELHYVAFQLHQKWQVKRGERVVDLIDLDIGARYLPYQEEAEQFNDGNHWTAITFDAVYRPTDNLTVYGDLAWELEDRYISSGSIGLDWRFRDHFRVGASHRYNRDPGDDYLSSESTFSIRWLASDKYALEYAFSREWADSSERVDSGTIKQRMTLIRNLKVFELALSVMRDHHRDDTGVYLTLSPLGVAPLERAEYEPIPGAAPGSRYGPSVVSDEAVLEQEPVGTDADLESVRMP